MAIRRESVRLELVDAGFTTGMARAAAATALLNRELRGVNDVDIASRLDSSSRSLSALSRDANRAESSINQLTGRLSLLGDAILTLGPAAIPVSAVAIPAVTTLASSLGFAALAAGSAAIAFGGVGDALETLNEAHLDPTTENLAEAEKALSRLAPAAQEFVRQIDSMRGLGADLRAAGAEGLFPGLTDALESLEQRGPDAERILRAINETVGQIAADGAASLASDRWDDFFTMLETEGPPTLDKTADAIGNVVHGLAELWEAFAPLNQDGLDWMVEMTEGFDEWATGLKDTEGFKDFTAYIRENGPQVADTVAAVAEAFVDVVAAAGPLGGPALRAIEALAEAVSAIAESDFATPLLAGVAAMRTINRLAPGTAGSLALLTGGAAAGGKAGKGGKGAKRGAKGGRGVNAGGALVGAFLGADLLANELGWEEATSKQMARADEFAKKWGQSWEDAAEDARVSLSKTLDVALGTGPFGLKANDRGLTDRLLMEPIERQIDLQKELRTEYGLGFKALENRGVLLDGFTEAFRRQRQQVSPLANDIKRLGEIKATPKLDLDDTQARRKRREAGDWLNEWGTRKERATLDLLDVDRRRKAREADDWITDWGNTRASARIVADAGQAERTMSLADKALRALDGRTATMYVRTQRIAGETPGFGPQLTGAAAGGPISRAGAAPATPSAYLEGATA